MENLAPKGTYRDPLDRHCWRTCMSCRRCSNKGSRPECHSCSGREDEFGQKVPNIDDKCRCTEGILQLVTKDNRFLQVKMLSNPFKGTIKRDAITEDERDYEEYLKSERERRNDKSWDPIQFEDGSSVTDWTNSRR